MATTLGAATAFPIPADGAEPERIARAWLTDVMQTESGNEVRAAVRSVAVRRYECTAHFTDALDAWRFRALWLAATERLRFIVPLWPRASAITAFPTSTTLAGDFANRGFVAGVKRAMVWLSEGAYELVDVVSANDTIITLAAALVGTYPAFATSIAPTMNAWLEPPIVEQVGVTAERVPLVFREELPGVSGIDPAVGASALPVVASVVIVTDAVGSPWAGRKFKTMRALVKDGAGVPIPNADVTWDVTPQGGATLDPPTKLTYPEGGQQLNIAYEGSTATAFLVTATAGAITSELASV